ncbi:hypothetical protein ZEAMMB73_Zm00001d031712 [Zea mays]|nr:hypothetical protein ZEAMMB73_Zm00001d031712 [Zea mays]
MNNHIGIVEHLEQNTESKDERAASDKQPEPVSRQHKHLNFPPFTTQIHLKKSATENPNVVNQVDIMKSVAGGFSSQLPRAPKEPSLLDERSLLACIVRAVPAGTEGGIRISSTLPNRLGKMLAPLHWHDYKKQYGKLDDFVASHPELFVIEGDFIHLRDGAQQIISATTAAAKIAAATASSASYSSLLPSVAVTPVAQNTRQKRRPAVDSRSSNAIPSGNGFTDQFNIIQGVSDVTISGKVRNIQDNGFIDEVRTGQPSVLTAATANGARHDKCANNTRHGYGGKQQGRTTGTTYLSRR